MSGAHNESAIRVNSTSDSLGTLRQVTKVVYHQQIEVVELPEHPRQIEVSLRRQHILSHEAIRGDEQHGPSSLRTSLCPMSAHRVSLAGAGQSEGEHVDVTVHEVTLCKPDELLPELEPELARARRCPRSCRQGAWMHASACPLSGILAVLCLLLQHLNQ